MNVGQRLKLNTSLNSMKFKRILVKSANEGGSIP